MWSVVIVGSLVVDGEQLYGYCDPDSLTISLLRGPVERMRATLRHELFHAAIASTGFYKILQITVENDKHREFLEEQLADVVMPAYLSAL